MRWTAIFFCLSGTCCFGHVVSWIHPEITRITRAAGKTTLWWTGTGDSFVSVERSTSLSSGSWQVVSSRNVTGFSADDQVSGPQAFYRVKANQMIRDVNVEPYLSAPAKGSAITVPVVLISYIPTNDGINKDVSKAPERFSLGPKTVAQVEQRLLQAYRSIKFSAEVGTSFRGYKNPTAQPYAGIRVLKHFVLHDVPLKKASWLTDSDYALNPMHEPDYHALWDLLGIEDLVNNAGVKEIWFFASHLHKGMPSFNGSIHVDEHLFVLPESNMSSPTSGDISNSFRAESDLPVYDKTYVVYGFNYSGLFDTIGSIDSNIHVRAHQVEVQLAWIDQSKKIEVSPGVHITTLYHHLFAGVPLQGGFGNGRVGGVHVPPNGRYDYDYWNTESVQSDIENWRPSGGPTKGISMSTWNAITYAWPDGMTPKGSDSQAQWLVYWFQNIPGQNNSITYTDTNVSPARDTVLSNWWDLFFNWDDAIRSAKTLWVK